MKRAARMPAVALASAMLVYAAVRSFVPGLVERRINTVHTPPPYAASARSLSALTIADLHSDALLWGRDLLARHDYGHVDLPRLQAANVALQVFSVPTRARTSDDHGFDRVLANAITEGWPPSTWASTYARAEHLAAALRRTSDRSAGTMTLIRSRADLESLLRNRERGRSVIGALLSLEGGHALEGDVARVDSLFVAGYRMVGLVHRFDNDIGGSSTGRKRGGLTPLGRRVVERMATLGIVIDLAHASDSLIADVVRLGRPVVVSHTGVRGTCDRSRNLSDDQVRAIAAVGGVVGIGFWSGAICGRTIDDVARAIMHAVRVAGARHVALGSDFDGDAVVIDPTGLPLLADALVARGLSERELALVMGENVVRIIATTLRP